MDGVARTAAGLVRGAEENGLWVFRGVPYARAGAGAGRWRAPEAPEHWTGIHDALAWGPIAPQAPPIPGLSLPGDPFDAAEDCLNLNIWTPGLDDARRPVMVWHHGGGFTTGTGASGLFDGRHLAAAGVVVVTFNYRLGALGFLAHPELADGDEDAGNWGLLDQLALLRWVQEHIAGFGGDPGNVTVFGESAGAMSIADVLCAPVAAGLFRRAVLQSGPPATGTVDWGARRAERLAELLGLGSLRRRSLESVPPDELVAATRQLAAQIPGDGGLPLPFLPVVDGVVLDQAPELAMADPAAELVPVLVGTTRDEAALYIAPDPSSIDLEPDGVVRRLGRLVSPEAAAIVVGTYQEARAGRSEPIAGRDLWTAVVSDYVFRLPSVHLAERYAAHGAAAFSYLFSWESPFLGGAFGSCHGLDVPFVFGSLANPVVHPFTGGGEDAFALSMRMRHAWLAFARTGDPSCDAVGDWPRYDSARRATMVLGRDSGLEDDPRGAERVVWDDVDAHPGGGHHHA
ncbi:MAG TPA: carboxylesterase family protein [Acidimicrobiales bacterium]|nr:carboxylesterase family protein [Acidimicrobiales bacterium]